MANGLQVVVILTRLWGAVELSGSRLGRPAAGEGTVSGLAAARYCIPQIKRKHQKITRGLYPIENHRDGLVVLMLLRGLEEE